MKLQEPGSAGAEVVDVAVAEQRHGSLPGYAMEARFRCHADMGSHRAALARIRLGRTVSLRKRHRLYDRLRHCSGPSLTSHGRSPNSRRFPLG